MPEHPTHKRRTRAHVIADLGVNYVERLALLAGFTLERVEHDYGIDLLMHTYAESGELEPGYINFQCKATDKPNLLAGKRAVAVRLDRRDLHSWLNEIYPVYLMLYNVPAETAYWLRIDQAALRKFDRRLALSATLHVPLKNRVTVESMFQFASEKRTILSRFRGSRR
ncbi:MAG TPA: DUF4365 domain-containing protein [Phycisphaerae bacterium]|nr:DUF4365 domain-containing protein [Phycisphaerae bacterium]